MNETLSLEEAHRTRQIGHRQAFDIEEALKEKVKELKSVDDSMKDNDMQSQCQTVQKLDKRCLHLENSIIKHTTQWATIKQEEPVARKRIEEEEEDIKEIDNRILEMRRELNGLKRLNQSYQALYQANSKCQTFPNPKDGVAFFHSLFQFWGTPTSCQRTFLVIMSAPGRLVMQWFLDISFDAGTAQWKV